MSSGIRQRRSITSSEMPSPASSSAAASASGTVAASATTVTSLPSRATRASPSGTTWSGGAGLALGREEPLVLEEDDRVVAADRRRHQADHVGRASTGAAIFRPGTVSAQFSTDCECWAPKPSPPPLAVRTTSGTVTWPPVM